MAEVRSLPEGALYWVQASGSGTAWATASAPASGLFGYVQSMNFTSGRRVVAVMDRGVPTHWKQVGRDPINLSVNFAWTGATPTAVSGASASVPMWHLEYKADYPEAANTATYYQFYGVVVTNMQWTEGDQDTVGLTMQALAMNGPTASGYLVSA
jgi:hypothetical protein